MAPSRNGPPGNPGEPRRRCEDVTPDTSDPEAVMIGEPDAVIVEPVRNPTVRAARVNSAIAIAVFAALGIAGLMFPVLAAGRLPTSLAVTSLGLMTTAGVLVLVRRGQLRRVARRTHKVLLVDFDSIVLRDWRGADQRWWKSEGDLVTVSGRQRHRVTIGDSLMEMAPLEADAFDLDELRAACVARGWSWQEGQAPPLEPFRVTAPAARHHSTVLLREGVEGRRELAGVISALTATCLVLVGGTAGLVVSGVLALPLATVPVSLAIAPVVSVAAISLWSRRLRVEADVDSHRFTLRYGGWTTAIARARVGKVLVGPRRLDFVDHTKGEKVYYAHHHGGRDSLAAALLAHDWPVVDDSGHRDRA